MNKVTDESAGVKPAPGAAGKRPSKLNANVLPFKRAFEEPVRPPNAIDLSLELRYTDDLTGEGVFAIGGVSDTGDTDKSLYKWNGAYWDLQVDAMAEAHALAWLRKNRPDKANRTAAVGALETAKTEMAGRSDCTVPGSGKHAIIPVQNAYLQIIDGKIHVSAPDRALGLTYHVPAAFNMTKVRDDGTYVPGPLNPDSKWGRYLARFMPDLEVRNLLQEACASSLLPMTLEKGFFLCGDGSNGKSTLLHILKALHPKHVAVRVDRLGDRFAMQPLQGKTLALVAEMPRRLEPAVQDALKALISRDPQQLEAKRKDIFTFTPCATFFFAVNKFPAVSGHEHGFWRKVLAIPFDVRLPEGHADRVPDFHKLIVEDPEEMSQLLDWLLEGALRLIARGGFDKELPERVRKLAEDHRIQTDTALAYLMDREVVVSKVMTSKAAIYDDYRKYTDHEAGKKPVSMEEFWTRTRERFPDIKDSQIWFNHAKTRAVSLLVEGIDLLRDDRSENELYMEELETKASLN